MESKARGAREAPPQKEPTTSQHRAQAKLDAALAYPERGIAVFPCQPGGKKPLTPNGFKDATTDRAAIEAWWRKYPDANIGAPVRRGEIVIDVDPKHGGNESLATLEQTYGSLPRTRTIQTGSGGCHYSFSHADPDARWKKELAPGIDLKVGGTGYVILPPSHTGDAVRTHPDG